ncbi:MAG: lysostaphin resistance A-like protein [Planctomycetota bacterium]
MRRYSRFVTADEPLCRYCTAPLDDAYYFCTTCGTPYRDEDLVLPRVPPLRPTAGMQIRARAPQAVRLFWTYFAVVAGGSIFAQLAFGDVKPVVALVFLDVLLLVTTLGFAIVYWPSLVPQFRRVGFDHWEAWVGLLALAPLLGLGALYQDLLRQLTGGEIVSPIARLREAGMGEGALLLAICVFPAIGEEIAFRGLLQHWLHVAVRASTAIVLASALFASLHFNLLSFPYLFVVGSLLGWLRWRTGSLWPSMAAHFAHNYVVLAYFAG